MGTHIFLGLISISLLSSCVDRRMPIIKVEKPTDAGQNANAATGNRASFDLSNVPENSSSKTQFSIKVSGENLSLYRYKFGYAGETNCAESSDYGQATVPYIPIELDLSEMEDGAVLLCVIGQSNQGSWLKAHEAVTKSWIKKTNGPSEVLGLTVEEQPDVLSLSWQGEIPEGSEYIVVASTTSFDDIILKDGEPYQVNMILDNGAKIIAKGLSQSLTISDLELGEDYYYAVYVGNKINLYSLPKIAFVESFNQPFAWQPSGQDESLYANSVLGGKQISNMNEEQNLYLCRALHSGVDNGLILGQLVPGPNNSLGQGRCYSIAFNQNDELRVIPKNSYEVLVIQKGKLGEHITWKGIETPAAVYPESIVSGYEGIAMDQTIACRATDDEKNLWRPGLAYYEAVDFGCNYSVYNGTSALITSTDTNFEILTYSNVFTVPDL